MKPFRDWDEHDCLTAAVLLIVLLAILFKQ